MLAMILVLTLVLAGIGAHGEMPEFNEILFENGKDALWMIASGDYDLALTILNFAEGAPTTQDFKKYIESTFLTIAIDIVQYEVAVAYWDGEIWTLAIPIHEPKDEKVETLLLFSKDGERFCGCGYMLWGDVELQMEKLYDVIWNVEYCPDNAFILTDDAKRGR